MSSGSYRYQILLSEHPSKGWEPLRGMDHKRNAIRQSHRDLRAEWDRRKARVALVAVQVIDLSKGGRRIYGPVMITRESASNGPKRALLPHPLPRRP